MYLEPGIFLKRPLVLISQGVDVTPCRPHPAHHGPLVTIAGDYVSAYGRTRPPTSMWVRLTNIGALVVDSTHSPLPAVETGERPGE
jgi:hypothetical protein